ncbi:hypothetical protein ACLOJK_037029, partial [Asimina triloba]
RENGRELLSMPWTLTGHCRWFGEDDWRGWVWWVGLPVMTIGEGPAVRSGDAGPAHRGQMEEVALPTRSLMEELVDRNINAGVTGDGRGGCGQSGSL